MGLKAERKGQQVTPPGEQAVSWDRFHKSENGWMHREHQAWTRCLPVSALLTSQAHFTLIPGVMGTDKQE